MGQTKNDSKIIYLTLDGVPEEVLLEQETMENTVSSKDARVRADGPGDVTVAMPSTVIEVLVSPDEDVSKGQALLVVEAMKMETELVAPFDGKIEFIHCKKGDVVNPGDALVKVLS
jgi:pyruvate carboxylase subunit B